MSDFERLKEMVAKLRAKERGPGEPRKLSGSTAAQRLSALITEINETILPRRLAFQWGEGPGIQLAVANRRLQGVLAPSEDVLQPHVGKPLSAPDDDVTEAVKTALLTVLEGATSITISAQHLGSDDLGSDAGVSAEALARQWGLAASAGPGDLSGKALPDFLSGLSGLATGWLSVEGEEVAGQDGAEADVARLGDTAAYLLDAYLNRKDSLFGAEEMPRCFAVAGAEEGVFFGDTGSQTVFVLTKPEDLVRVVALWRGSFG